LAGTQKVKDIQSFLGFTNFYRHFNFGYSEITILLTCLTRKGTLGTSPMSAIQPLKHLKGFPPQLQSLPIGFQTLKLQSKLMPQTTHLLLSFSITTSNGKLHPIVFHSRTFSTPELNYDIHDKELLSIFEAFK